MFFKFVFDRVVALIGLTCLLPVLVIIAVLIRIKTPGGKVLFRQERVGRHGRLFSIVKFRTMNDNLSGSTISVAGENRITPLGSVLRKHKIDELPELWNVLIGDMSFVGPRPDVPGYADKLEGEDRRILELRPGITGPASLKYRNEEELLANVDAPQQYNDEVIYPDKTRINLYYLNHYSFIKDLQIIICTVLGKKMEYGGEII